MSAESLFFALIILSHGVIFYASNSPRRLRRLIEACSTFALSIPLMFLGVLLGLGADQFWLTVSKFLIYSPLPLAIVSFAIHLRPIRENGIVAESLENESSNNPMAR